MDRRDFLGLMGTGLSGLTLGGVAAAADGVRLPAEWGKPGAEFSMAPFWFWNDRLSQKEIARQMADFQAHGVHAFVIHPRAGLPRDTGWMSDRMIHFMRFAIEEAARRGMWVVLYDEGMYPSGSSCGQVVAENAAYKCRGLVRVDLDEAKPGAKAGSILIGPDGMPALSPDQNLVAIVKRKANAHRIAVIDKAIDAVIRGLHFTEEDPPRRANHKEVAEDAPPAADLLNPEAVACFIRLVYQRFYDEFGRHFGKTVKAIFTDEPSLVGKLRERGVVAGTTGIVRHVNRFLGYDFTPHLPALWYADEPDAARYRRDYNQALRMRLEETYYAPIRRWCDAHSTKLTGHPAKPDDIGHLRHFHIPGQDIVWRYIEPGKPSALEGAQSTQAKCASAAMINRGLRRNSNEFCGAYGHNFTFEEMKWLANWLIVRGCNLLYPHAFYYSIRGPRIDERPPDVGPNNTWWKHFKPFADLCSRLCWLNTDSRHVCDIAILGRSDYLPWRAAKVCYQNQIDFNYLEARHLWEDAKVDATGIRIAGMHYRALVIEGDVPEKALKAVEQLSKAERVIRWTSETADADFVKNIDGLVKRDIRVEPAPADYMKSVIELFELDVRMEPRCADLRVRHVVKGGLDWYVLFNEGEGDIAFQAELGTKGKRYLVNPWGGKQTGIAGDEIIWLRRHDMLVVVIKSS